MSTGKPIPTPWKHRWRRFRYSWMPVLCFTATLALTLWLWDNQGQMANAVGEVEVVRLDVTAETAGKLIRLDSHEWALFDHVAKDQVIARLDDSLVQASKTTLQAELNRLHEEVNAAESQTMVELASLKLNHVQEIARLAYQVEQTKLRIADYRVQLEPDKLELKRLQTKIDILNPPHGDRHVHDLVFSDLESQRDGVEARIQENSAAIEEATRQLTTAQERLQALPPLELPQLEALLRPIQASVRAQEARIDELEVQIKGLEIRAPIDGTICGIHCWPGQVVQPGQPILTIAAQNTGYVVSYVRQNHRVRPSAGMQVALRMRLPGSRPVPTQVERVGPQIEEVPPHHRRDPAVLEWGLPVRIRLPNEMAVRPGELVDITFKPPASEDEGAG